MCEEKGGEQTVERKKVNWQILRTRKAGPETRAKTTTLAANTGRAVRTRTAPERLNLFHVHCPPIGRRQMVLRSNI